MCIVWWAWTRYLEDLGDDDIAIGKMKSVIKEDFIFSSW